MDWQQRNFAQNIVRDFENLGRAYQHTIQVPFVDLRRGHWQPKGNDSKTGREKWNNMAYGRDIAKQEYSGRVENKLPNGWGRWSIEGSRRLEYEGHWQDGLPNGINGIFMLDGAIVYQGPVCSGRPDGEGRYFWADGTTYSGRLTKGNFNGEGTMQRGTMIYRDFWNQGRRTGQPGVFTWYLWRGQAPLRAFIWL
jgi:hypothetical protein